ncbi:MAG: hypothetical protein JO250_05340 [Armatimonadetes bacterium]|nr:hypothetical protein [Armatimonadota bacterium]
MRVQRCLGVMAGLWLAMGGAWAAPSATAGEAGAGRALTIYNQNFAVVRETVPLSLSAGVNHLTFSDITYHLEPDSVVLRDPTGQRALQILEQNYRADPISQELLLSRYEGKTIDFQTRVGDHTEIVPGKIIRSGYVPHNTAFNYDQAYYAGQAAYAYGGGGQPLIEVNGKLQFALPGTPLFPALADDSILKPTLDWTLRTDRAGPLNAELAYVTGGMSWKADYNVVSPQQGSDLDLVGWVTMDNQSGRTFENARIKLMAGDVNKVQPQHQYGGGFGGGAFAARSEMAPPVTEKAFDEYHLYTLQRPATLRDRETKQVEFVRAQGVHSAIVYVYDGAYIDPGQYYNWTYETIRSQPSYGTQSNPKVWTMREIVNSQANGLGIPLPKGRVRFYRKDADGQLEFIGENEIDHTPKDETLRVYTGNAFDLAGERRQTNYNLASGNSMLDESFEIKVRNHKATPVEIRVVEHLYRGLNWTITEHSLPFLKTDAHTMEFHVPLAPDQEKTITYTAHYTW